MESPLRVKSTDFAIRIVRLYQYLTLQKNEYVLSKQILRCGTNPGAMVRTDYITLIEHDSLYKDAEELMKMIRSSILTKKKNLKGDK